MGNRRRQIIDSGALPGPKPFLTANRPATILGTPDPVAISPQEGYSQDES